MKFLSVKKVLPLVLLGTLILSGCKKSSSLSIADVSIPVGNVTPLAIVFTPASEARAIVYTIENPLIASITDDSVLGIAEGKTSVSAVAGTLSATFTITVTAKIEPAETIIEEFNRYGSFDGGLEGWVLSGENLDSHVVEADNGRSGHDTALKFWVDGTSAIDLTLTSTFSPSAEFEAGKYTITFELVGNLETVSVHIDEEEFTLADEDIKQSQGAYVKSYLHFTLAEKGGFSFDFNAQSPDLASTWGYLDSITLLEGHIDPEVVEEGENILADGGFEEIGAAGGFGHSDVWTSEVIVSAPNLTAFFATWAIEEKYSLKFDYWPSSITDMPQGEIKVSQEFSVEEAADYVLSYYLATGGLPGTTIKILQGDEVVFENSTDIDGTVEFELKTEDAIELATGEYKLVIHFKDYPQVWAHFDDFKLIKAE